MEQNLNQGGVVENQIGDGAKKNTGMIVGMVACAILALGGVGFGVYEMIQANQTKDQISDLKVEVKKDDGTVTAIETPEVKTTAEDGTTVTIADLPTKVENPDEYIWVGVWGVKIKIPTSLKNVAYTFNNYGDLCVSGVKYIEGGMHYAPEFAMIDKNTPGLACVSRDSRRESQVTFGNHEYSVSGSQAVYSIDESEQNWEVNSRALVLEMLSTASNYSEI